MKRFLFALSMAILLGWLLGKRTQAEYLNPTAPDSILADDEGEIGYPDSTEQWVF